MSRVCSAAAGLDASKDIISAVYLKDPSNPRWKDDEGVKAYRAFFDKYLAGSDITNTSYLTGYQQGLVLDQILRQCGDDLSRDNIIKQAKSLKDLVLATALPGVRINQQHDLDPTPASALDRDKVGTVRRNPRR